MEGHPLAEQPYNPLDKRNLGKSIADALLVKQVIPLSAIEPFTGAGIYAIYFIGNFPAYEPIASKNKYGLFKLPIYVGKAVPAGARKGGFLEADPGPVLFRRLDEHIRSIEQANNLNIKDFYCRYLVVDEFWIPLAEALLIDTFSPLWNVVIDGFGNHDPGSGRYNQQRSYWDVLHPGRPWAEKLQDNRLTKENVLELVANALKSKNTD
ncbi:MAG: Eco29kI family restriction endonuclease [Firmicutes bacterium]|nr:Eco29kI family restriction endonuclease [Bacillota bacterium]